MTSVLFRSRDGAGRVAGAVASVITLVLLTACGGETPDAPDATDATGVTDVTDTKPTSQPTPDDPQRTSWDESEPAEPLSASEPTTVRIPGLDIAQDTIPVGLDDDRAMQVPQGAEPIGWYDLGPTPGEIGPAIMIGHLTWNGADGVFRHLDTLDKGDTIEVERADGSMVEFVVTRIAEYDQSDFPTARVYGNTRGPELRLITCSGDYDPATRSFSSNVVVYATMVDADA